jgi:hypothetical protein
MEFTSASDDSLWSYTKLSFLSLFISVCETVRVDRTKLFSLHSKEIASTSLSPFHQTTVRSEAVDLTVEKITTMVPLQVIIKYLQW